MTEEESDHPLQSTPCHSCVECCVYAVSGPVVSSAPLLIERNQH